MYSEDTRVSLKSFEEINERIEGDMSRAFYDSIGDGNFKIIGELTDLIKIEHPTLKQYMAKRWFNFFKHGTKVCTSEYKPDQRTYLLGCLLSGGMFANKYHTISIESSHEERSIIAWARVANNLVDAIIENKKCSEN